MTEITTYKCDVCGKEFNNEDKCLEHELKCKTAGLENFVVMMDCNKNILPLEDWERAIDRAHYIYITNQEVADKLKDLFYEYTYNFPTDDIEGTVSYPALFIYQDNIMCWNSLQKIENEYNELFIINDKM